MSEFVATIVRSWSVDDTKHESIKVMQDHNDEILQMQRQIQYKECGPATAQQENDWSITIFHSYNIWCVLKKINI